MAIKFKNVEEIKTHEAGEYLMKITSAKEVDFKSGNSGVQIDFESKDGVKLRFVNFFTEGKGANNFLNLLSALGMYDGGGWENVKPFEAEDLIGLFVYVDAEKDSDNKYLVPKFCGYRKYEGQEVEKKAKPKAEAPF